MIWETGGVAHLTPCSMSTFPGFPPRVLLASVLCLLTTQLVFGFLAHPHHLHFSGTC